VIAGGWWWHNWRATGFPFFNLSAYLLMGYTDRWPGISVLRDFALAPAEWPQRLLEQAPMLPRKARAFLPHALKRALLAPSTLTGWLTPIGLVVAVARASTRWVAVAAFVCALAPVAVMCFTLYDSRYLVPFLPLWALAAAVAAEWLWGRLPRVGRTRGWLVVLALLVLPASVPAMREEVRAARRLEARLARERTLLMARAGGASALPRLTALGVVGPEAPDTASRRLMFSDTPDFVAWTTGRPTLWVTVEEYRRLPAPETPSPSAGRSAARPVSPTAAPRVAPGALPARGTAADTWFHGAPR